MVEAAYDFMNGKNSNVLLCDFVCSDIIKRVMAIFIR